MRHFVCHQRTSSCKWSHDNTLVNVTNRRPLHLCSYNSFVSWSRWILSLVSSCCALPCPLFRLQSSWWHDCPWWHGLWLQICSPQWGSFSFILVMLTLHWQHYFSILRVCFSDAANMCNILAGRMEQFGSSTGRNYRSAGWCILLTSVAAKTLAVLSAIFPWDWVSWFLQLFETC